MECCLICTDLLDCGNILRKIKDNDVSLLAYIEADEPCLNFELNTKAEESEVVRNRLKTVLNGLLEKNKE